MHLAHLLQRTVGTVVTIAALVTACEAIGGSPPVLDLVDEARIDEPVASFTLPGGTELQLVASEIRVTDEVTVVVERTDDVTWDVTVTNLGDEPVLVAEPTHGDGAQRVGVRSVDLPYERGEVIYVAPPTHPMRWVDAGDAFRLASIALPDGADPVVAVEVAPAEALERPRTETPSTGDEVHAHVRGSDGSVTLAVT